MPKHPKKTPLDVPKLYSRDSSPPKKAEIIKNLGGRFPDLNDPNSTENSDHQPRPVYFAELDDLTREFLVGRGYAPRVLTSLPMGTPEEEKTYLKALAQGVLEGTIPPPRGMASTIRVLFEEAGLIGKRHQATNEASSTRQGALEEALEWSRSRHTIDNSTHSRVRSRDSDDPTAT